jgi:hypothetical protein
VTAGKRHWMEAEIVRLFCNIQDVPVGKVNILGGHSIGPSRQKVCMDVCPIPNGFRDRTISLYRQATHHVLTRVAKCIDTDGIIFENVLY